MDFDELQSHYTGSRARHYERVRTRNPKWHREQEVVTGLITEFTREGGTVVDVPVGTGRFFRDYAKLNVKVIGVDISQDMLLQAAERAKTIPNLRTQLLRSDITEMPLPDGVADLVVCIRFASLVTVVTLERALREMSRIGTRIVIGMTTRVSWITPIHAVSAFMARLARNIIPGAGRVVVHQQKDIEQLFARHKMEIERQLEVRRRPFQGDKTAIYVLRSTS